MGKKKKTDRLLKRIIEALTIVSLLLAIINAIENLLK